VAALDPSQHFIQWVLRAFYQVVKSWSLKQTSHFYLEWKLGKLKSSSTPSVPCCLSKGTASNKVRGFYIRSVEALCPTIRKLILNGQEFFCIDVRSSQRGL